MANYNVSGLISLAELANSNKNFWYVYILKCSDDTYYTGITKNIKRRIHEHETNKGAKYTKSRLPVALVYEEHTHDKSRSLKREIEIKKLTRSKKIELINSANLSTA